MALLKIARMGHPVLLRRADPLGSDIASPTLQRLVDDMILTMHDADGIGLAAPQVHESLRLIVAMPIAQRGSKVEPLVIADPIVEPLGDAIEDGVEGCLSIPEIRGIVPRAAKVRWRGTARDGRAIGGVAEGLFARVLQHEVDHLDGILYPMRMTDLSRLAFLEHGRELVRGTPDEQDEAQDDDVA